MNKLTIIICVKNREGLISATIDSILDQANLNFDILIKDGMSSDNTVAIAESKLSESGFKDYTIVSERDENLSNAFNQSMSYVSNGDIIFLHSDDTFTDKNALSTLLSHHKSVWAFGFYKFINRQGDLIRCEKIPQDISFARMMISNQVRHQCAVVNSLQLKRIKFGNYKYALDYDFFINLWKNSKPYIVADYITNFRLHDNLSARFFSSLFDEFTVRFNHRIFGGQYKLIAVDILVLMVRVLKLSIRLIFK